MPGPRYQVPVLHTSRHSPPPSNNAPTHPCPRPQGLSLSLMPLATRSEDNGCVPAPDHVETRASELPSVLPAEAAARGTCSTVCCGRASTCAGECLKLELRLFEASRGRGRGDVDEAFAPMFMQFNASVCWVRSWYQPCWTDLTRTKYPRKSYQCKQNVV
jgi:hypothetical protein